MKFRFTMNIPSNSGKVVHQVIGEHPATDIHALASAMAAVDLLVVREFYVFNDKDTGDSVLEDRGLTGLNPLFIGKVKAFED